MNKVGYIFLRWPYEIHVIINNKQITWLTFSIWSDPPSIPNARRLTTKTKMTNIPCIYHLHMQGEEFKYNQYLNVRARCILYCISEGKILKLRHQSDKIQNGTAYYISLYLPQNRNILYQNIDCRPYLYISF